MPQLSYDTLAKAGYKGFLLPQGAIEKVLQFGDGNFLRAFADVFVDLANEKIGWNGKVVLVQPRSKNFDKADALNTQQGLYTVCTRGNEDGTQIDETRVISCVSRCLNPRREADYQAMIAVATSPDLELIISNTTEAGIVYDASAKADDLYPESFPAKLTQVLHARWQAGRSGVVMLSCELIDHNGEELLKIVHQHVNDWGWESAFSQWLDTSCTFCTTLVDTIVPGGIRDAQAKAAMAKRLGYDDPFLVVREPFQMWGIQGTDELAQNLPFTRAQIPGIFVTPDVTPYKKRKVRILNGAHTGFVPGAWLAGFSIVRDCMHDMTVHGFMNQLLEQEVIPTLTRELDEQDLKDFTQAVTNRFDNPFVDHQLLSICLNSTAKWAARDLPTLEDYVQATGKIPACLATSLAALLAFYTTGFEGVDVEGLHLRRADGTAYTAQDSDAALNFFAAHAADDAATLAHAALSEQALWGKDLTQIAGLEPFVAARLALIHEQGVLAAFAACAE